MRCNIKGKKVRMKKTCSNEWNHWILWLFLSQIHFFDSVKTIVEIIALFLSYCIQYNKVNNLNWKQLTCLQTFFPVEPVVLTLLKVFISLKKLLIQLENWIPVVHSNDIICCGCIFSYLLFLLFLSISTCM
jgi:hypothetical protein